MADLIAREADASRLLSGDEAAVLRGVRRGERIDPVRPPTLPATPDSF
jgi:hypothetical protein